MNSAAEEIQARLFALQDQDYRRFHQRLIPTVPEERIIGVRTPEVRRLARELKGTREGEEFLHSLPHQYYDENNLHAFLLEPIRDFDRVLEEVERFLPYVDNWATCDMMRPRAFGKHLPQLLEQVRAWLNSERPFTVRFAVGMLMSYYLDEAFQLEYLELAAKAQCQEYYVNMMVAWYFATALAKQWEATLPWLQEERLSLWCHNKTIQKAVESRRITPEQKDYLKALRRRA